MSQKRDLIPEDPILLKSERQRNSTLYQQLRIGRLFRPNTVIITVIIYICSPQGGVDGDGKDDLDSGDEAEGKKIDTEEVNPKS